MKTIIHVWTHEFNIDQEHIKKYNYLNETNFYFGLGDLIRSTVKLFYLSKIMNFNFIVDYQLHPISNFLKQNRHEYSDLVYLNRDNVDYVCYSAVEDYINTSNSNILFLLTNDFYDGEICNECKTFIKNVLTPNEEFQHFINIQMSHIPYESYQIMHFRFGDDEFLKKNSNYDSNFYINYLQTNSDKNDVLITDSVSFKKFVFMNHETLCFDTKICHLGLSKDLDEVRDTLFEFFLITKSLKIKTYCRIHSISGFVKWIHKIYDIPIMCMN